MTLEYPLLGYLFSLGTLFVEQIRNIYGYVGMILFSFLFVLYLIMGDEE